MMSSRLLVIAILICSAGLFAQEAQQKTLAVANQPLLTSGSQSAFSSPRINPLGMESAEVSHDPLARLESSQPPRLELDQNRNPKILFFPEPSRGFVISPGQLADGTTCYAIRSYVVARDSKHSDSVHPAGYSTCVPAKKVQLKSATGSVQPVQLER